MCYRVAMALEADSLEPTIPSTTGIPSSKIQKWVDKDKYKPSHNGGPNRYQPVLFATKKALENNNSSSDDVKDLYGESKDNHDSITYTLQSMKWGLIPSWTKTKSDFATTLKTANCRDDVLSDPQGSSLWNSVKHRHRCIVFAEGFYEWKKSNKDRIPYFIRRKDGQLIMFAGLYDRAKLNDEPEPLFSYTIITTSPNKLVSAIHDRMPVILEKEDIETWMDPNSNFNETKSKLVTRPIPAEKLEMYQVDSYVNKEGNDGEKCRVSIDEIRKTKGLDGFFAKMQSSNAPSTPIKSSIDKVEEKKRPIEESDDPVQTPSSPKRPRLQSSSPTLKQSPSKPGTQSITSFFKPVPKKSQ